MIEVHIERLVLDGMGLDGAGVDRLRAAVEHHLAGDLAGRLLAPELAGGAAVPSIDAADVTVDPANPGHTGRRLAATLAESLAPGGVTTAGPRTPGGQR